MRHWNDFCFDVFIRKFGFLQNPHYNKSILYKVTLQNKVLENNITPKFDPTQSELNCNWRDSENNIFA